MSVQPDSSECQRTNDQSSGGQVHVPAEHGSQFKIAGNKYYIHTTGKTLKCHEDITNVLQQTHGLEEVKLVTACDVILMFCTIVSRAGTDIEAALKKLNSLSDSKPAIFVVLHQTFDPEKTVLDSSKCVNRSNTLTVDCLFHEDEGLLKCTRNNEALDKIQQCLPTQETWWSYVLYFVCHAKKKTETQEEISTAAPIEEPDAKLLKEIKELLTNNDQSNLSVASEFTIFLLGMAESGESEVANTIFWGDEKSQAGVSTAIKKTTVERGTVSWEQVSVIDYSDWFTSSLSLEEMKQNIHLCSCIYSCKPYVFLLVIPVTQFTTKQRDMVRKMEKSFEETGWNKVVILFTITTEQENQTLEMFIHQQNLQSLVQKCENRFTFNQTGNSAQVSELLEKMQQMFAGECETKDVLSHSDTAISKSHLPENQHTVSISKSPRKEKIVTVLSNLIKRLSENPETTVGDFVVVELEK